MFTEKILFFFSIAFFHEGLSCDPVIDELPMPNVSENYLQENKLLVMFLNEVLINIFNICVAFRFIYLIKSTRMFFFSYF